MTMKTRISAFLSRPMHRLGQMLWRVVVALAAVVVLWYLSSIFIFASFRVPTPSMSPTLIPGDYILVNKMAYGARLFDFRHVVRHGDISRMRGYSEPVRNDVMVFNNPYSHGDDTISMDVLKYLVKRCVALPGDSIEIVDGYYRVRGVDDALGYVDSQKMVNAIAFDTASVISSYGPLYVPKAGDTISLDTVNAPFYRKLIEWELDKSITNEGNDFYAEDSLMGCHVMRQGYYFMAGDDCLNSRDSRYWGLVPEDFVVGRVCLIWKSKNIYTDKMKWERVFTIVE